MKRRHVFLSYDPEKGETHASRYTLWVDGEQISGVSKVAIVAEAGKPPQVQLTVLADMFEADLALTELIAEVDQ